MHRRWFNSGRIDLFVIGSAQSSVRARVGRPLRAVLLRDASRLTLLPKFAVHILSFALYTRPGPAPSTKQLAKCDISGRLASLQKACEPIGADSHSLEDAEQVKHVVELEKALTMLVGMSVPEAKANVLNAIGYSFPIVLSALKHRSADVLAFDKFMLLWALYFEVFGNGDEQKVYEAASCFRTIRLRLDEIAGEAKDTVEFANSAQVTFLTVLWQRCACKLEALEGMSQTNMPRGVSLAGIVEGVKGVRDEVHAFLKTMEGIERRERQKTFDEAYQTIADIPHALLDTPQWWEASKWHASFETLEAASKTICENIDAKTARESVKLLDTARQSLKACLMKYGEVQMPEVFDTVDEMKKGVALITTTMQLFYLLSQSRKRGCKEFDLQGSGGPPRGDRQAREEDHPDGVVPPRLEGVGRGQSHQEEVSRRRVHMQPASSPHRQLPNHTQLQRSWHHLYIIARRNRTGLTIGSPVNWRPHPEAHAHWRSRGRLETGRHAGAGLREQAWARQPAEVRGVASRLRGGFASFGVGVIPCVFVKLGYRLK